MEPDERELLAPYCALLAERLGEDLLTVMALGPELELLVVTATDLSDDVQAQLAEEAYPFTPCFVPERCLVSPVDERTQRLLDRMRTVGVNVWPGPVSM